MAAESSILRRDLLLQRMRKVSRAVREPAFFPAMRRGVLPTTEHSRVPFGAVATVIDVGASHGQFAVHARTRWPDAHIICFEPVPAALEILRQLAQTYRLELHGAAVGRTAERVTLQVAADDDSSSLLRPTPLNVAVSPGTQIVSTTEVDSVRLDDLELPTGRPCLLKIDTQGTEKDVLDGARSTLDVVDQVYLECSYVELYEHQPLAGEIVSYLQELGFRLAGVHNTTKGLGGKQLQADFHFTRPVQSPAVQAD